MKRLVLVFMLLALLPACAHCGTERVKPETDPEWCAAAEKNLTHLECLDPITGRLITEYVCDTTDGGPCTCDDPSLDTCHSFTEVCKDVQAADIPFEAQCMAKMTDCAQLETDCNYTE